jgi:hypothetical protein
MDAVVHRLDFWFYATCKLAFRFQFALSCCRDNIDMVGFDSIPARHTSYLFKITIMEIK